MQGKESGEAKYKEEKIKENKIVVRFYFIFLFVASNLFYLLLLINIKIEKKKLKLRVYW